MQPDANSRFIDPKQCKRSVKSYTLHGHKLRISHALWKCAPHLPATRLPTPETALSSYAGISGNGGQVAFMPYGVVLKDERRTSNIERPTSNEKTNIQYRTFNSYFCFFIFSHSTFDVGRSMFDVHFFQSLLGKTT